jgi:hypothetical protein
MNMATDSNTYMDIVMNMGTKSNIHGRGHDMETDIEMNMDTDMDTDMDMDTNRETDIGMYMYM